MPCLFFGGALPFLLSNGTGVQSRITVAVKRLCHRYGVKQELLPNEGSGKCPAAFLDVIKNLAHFQLAGGGAGSDKEAFVLFIFDKYRAG